MGWINLKREKYNEAIAYHEKLPTGNYYNMMRGYAYLKAGQRERAMELWKEMEELAKTQDINTCYRGFMAAYMGFTDKSFELLNEAIDKKQYPITYINLYPYTEDIRKDPRYGELLRKLNLPYEKILMVSK
jgi:tetratricopeptide (TPR) repeat protein